MITRGEYEQLLKQLAVMNNILEQLGNISKQLAVLVTIICSVEEATKSLDESIKLWRGEL